MRKVDTKIDEVMTAMTPLDFLDGFPETERGLRVIAGVIGRMVKNELVTHPKLGQVNDLDWLIESIVGSCDKFPSVPAMRRMYEQYFRPQDEAEQEMAVDAG